MPEITSIEPQKKKKGRFNIFLDGQFAFGIDENTLVKNRLKIGQLLTSDQIAKLIKETILSKLVDLALHFLSYRPRSEKEVCQYLIKKISQKENIKYSLAKESPLLVKVMIKLKRYQYINDLEFAKWWVKSRLKSKPKGVRLIKLELIEKGIDREIVEQVLSKSIDQVALAKKAIEKRIKRWQGLSEVDFRKKIYAYLVNRGFDFETIREVFAFFKKNR